MRLSVVGEGLFPIREAGVVVEEGVAEEVPSSSGTVSFG